MFRDFCDGSLMRNVWMVLACIALVFSLSGSAFADEPFVPLARLDVTVRPKGSATVQLAKVVKTTDIREIQLRLSGSALSRVVVTVKKGGRATKVTKLSTKFFILDYSGRESVQLKNSSFRTATVRLSILGRKQKQTPTPSPSPSGGTPTATPVASQSPTRAPTAVTSTPTAPAPTATARSTATPALTSTATPTATSPTKGTATATATSSPTQRATNTPTSTATFTPTSKPTNTPTSKATATATPSPSPTSSNITDIPPGVGHNRTCSSVAKFTPKKTIYVATTGSDSAPGTQAQPLRTLQQACDTVQPGEAIYVQAGTYKGCTIYTSGTQTLPIMIQAAPATSGFQAVTIDGKSPATSTSHGVLNAEGAAWVTFRGFIVTGTDARTGIRIVAGEGQSVCDNTINNSLVWGVLGGFTEGALVEGNSIYKPQQQHGIYFGEGDDHYVIRGNYIESPYSICFHNNGSGGMNTGALIENNICYKGALNGGAQLNMDGVEDSVVRNNIFFAGGRNGIALFNINGGFASRNNRIVGNTFFFEGNTGYYAIAVNENATGNKIFNNIMYRAPNGIRGSMAVDPTALSGFESDYNVFAGSSTGAVNFDDSYNESNPISLSAWQQMGYDTHSKVADSASLFVNSASGDFHLKPGSPAKGAGIAKPPYLVRDFAGTLRKDPPSIGAFE